MVSSCDVGYLPFCDALMSMQNKRVRLIATDGVFSMDGDIAPLQQICALAEKYDASVCFLIDFFFFLTCLRSFTSENPVCSCRSL